MFFFVNFILDGLHVFLNHVHPYGSGQNGTRTFMAGDLFDSLHHDIGL